MEEKINQSLNEELARQIEDLKSFETGSREMDNAVEDVVKLHKLLMESDRLDVEIRKLEIEESKNRSDSEYKKANEANILAEQKKDRYVKIAITAVEIGISVICSCVWFSRGLRFEEKGSYTSKTPQTVNTFMSFANKFRHTK